MCASARRKGSSEPWRQVPVTEIAVAPGGWRAESPVVALKLQASVRRYGQLRPIVVRALPDGRLEAVRGRSLLRAMLAVGVTSIWIVDVGVVPDAEAIRLALALEVGAEPDYARLAPAVAALLDAGVTPDELSSCSPFNAERIRYFGVLSKFDWSQFAPVTSGQEAMDWDAATPDAAPVLEPAPTPVAVPPEETGQAAADVAIAAAALDVFDFGDDGQAALS